MRDDGESNPVAPATPSQPVLDEYARAVARLRGLPIEEQWWPGVLRHLGTILELGADVETHDARLAEEPGRPARG